MHHDKTSEPDRPHQREAFNIFQSAWLDLQEAQHHNSPPTIDEIVKQMGDKLTAATAAKPVVGSGAFLYSTLPAIVDYASQSPASLELMLQAYVHAAKNHSTRVSNGYGTGTEAAIGQLN
jgi:hypothetical protein